MYNFFAMTDLRPETFFELNDFEHAALFADCV